MPITDELLMTTAAASNTTLGGAITLDGTVMTPSQVDDAFRELMAYRARAITRHVAKAAGTYSAAKADHNQFWRCTGAVTVNLAAAATLTDGWCLWVRANGGAVTIDPNGAETIDGAATLVLSDGLTALVICTGTAFFVAHAGPAGPAYAALDALTLQGTAIASAATTDIGAATGRYVHITGTTTITALGTKAAGVERELVFDGILTFTHNATTLILPGAANITTAAGDVAVMVSEGAGNWRCVSYQQAAFARIQSGTQVASTSGTSIDFTGIPPWAKRITIMLNNVSTSGTSPVILQLGDSGGIETSGYSGGLGNIAGSTASSAAAALNGVQVVSGATASARYGVLTINLMNAATFTWVITGIVGDSQSAAGMTAAVKSTSAALDRIRITTVGGTDTFDLGTINITWE